VSVLREFDELGDRVREGGGDTGAHVRAEFVGAITGDLGPVHDLDACPVEPFHPVHDPDGQAVSLGDLGE
jgi:hypothetical protein